MSYLLKALQKAEQERQQASHQDEVKSAVSYKQSKLPLPIVMGVLLLVLITIWQLVKPDSVSNQPHEVSVVGAVENTELTEERVTHTKTTQSMNNKVESNEAQEVVVPVKTLSDLNRKEIAMIPSLDLASHIYSSEAEYRSVVINDQTYKEGMLIEAGLILEEINQSGIIINIAGLKIELPKGISWVASQNAK